MRAQSKSFGMIPTMNTEHYKEKLESEKTMLESEMQKMGRRNPGVPNDWEPIPQENGTKADLMDQADVVLEHESDTTIFDDLEVRYDAVLAALSRIEKNTYGVCEKCGETIEEARLSANPAASSCVVHV